MSTTLAPAAGATATAAATETARERRLEIAMLAAGLATFSLLHATQALLPSIRHTFGGGETLASLTVSAATGAVAVFVLPVSSLAESLGRVRLMKIGLLAAALFTVLAGLVPAYWELMVVRGLVGVSLAAVASVATAHIVEEAPGANAARAVGLYVAGTSVGGLVGRLVPTGVEELGGWRAGLIVLAAVDLVAAGVFVALLPPARHFHPAPLEFRHHLAAITEHLREPGIRRLCLAAFLFMGGLTAVYNYLGFRLTRAPFGLPQWVAGLVFVTYLAGTVTSSFAGRLTTRWTRRQVVCGGALVAAAGLLLTIPDTLPLAIAGLVVFTAGFFAAHSVSTGWVAARARSGRSQASALYLVAYYAGASVVGALMGLAFDAGGWAAVAVGVSMSYLLGVILVGRIQDQNRFTVSDMHR